MNTVTVRYFDAGDVPEDLQRFYAGWDVVYTWNDDDAYTMNFEATRLSSPAAPVADIEGNVNWEGCINWKAPSWIHACDTDDAVTPLRVLFDAVSSFARKQLRHSLDS